MPSYWDANGNLIDGKYGVQIIASDIMQPVDIQAIYRVLAFNTVTTLGASATYTGSSIDGLQARRLTGRAFADQAGTLNIQASDNGSTWDTVKTIAVTANTAITFDELFYARYTRVTFVNGATAQTAFRLSGYTSVM